MLLCFREHFRVCGIGLGTIILKVAVFLMVVGFVLIVGVVGRKGTSTVVRRRRVVRHGHECRDSRSKLIASWAVLKQERRPDVLDGENKRESF